MTDILVEAWQSKVQRRDTVYVLGDFAFNMSRPDVKSLLRRLPGQKCLIAGDHDHRNVRRARGWAWVKDIYYMNPMRIEFHLCERRFALCHWPLESWRGKFHGSIHVHGHCHGRSNTMERRVDCGVDVTHGSPISISAVEILSRPGMVSEARHLASKSKIEKIEESQG